MGKLKNNEKLRFLYNAYEGAHLNTEKIKKYFILSLVTMLFKPTDFIRDDHRNSNYDRMKFSHPGNLEKALATKLTGLNDEFGKYLSIGEFKKRVTPARAIFHALKETANSNLPLKEKIELYRTINHRARYFGTDDNTAGYSSGHITKQMKTYKQSATGYGVLALLSAAVAALGGVLAECADCSKPDDLLLPKAFDFSNFFDGHSAVAQWCHSPGGLVILGVIFAAGVFAGYQAWADARTRSAFEDLMGPVGHLNVSRAN